MSAETRQREFHAIAAERSSLSIKNWRETAETDRLIHSRVLTLTEHTSFTTATITQNTSSLDVDLTGYTVQDALRGAAKPIQWIPAAWRHDIMHELVHQPEAAFVALVHALPRVLRIYALRDEDMTRLWTILDVLDLDAEKAIHEAEAKVWSQYPELDFDFFVIPLSGRDIRELVPQEFQLLYQARDAM